MFCQQTEYEPFLRSSMDWYNPYNRKKIPGKAEISLSYIQKRPDPVSLPSRTFSLTRTVPDKLFADSHTGWKQIFTHFLPA